MLTVGIPGIYGDFGWECTKCGKVLQGMNPFKDQDASHDTAMQEIEDGKRNAVVLDDNHTK